MPKKNIVSIIGTGVIGAGWAARFLAKGYIVKAYDPNKQSLDQLKINVKTAFKSLRKVGLNKNASLANLKTYTDLERSLKNTTFVQESAPENEKIKKEILRKIDLIVGKNIVIASSSSGLLPSNIQLKCKHPERMWLSAGKSFISDKSIKSFTFVFISASAGSVVEKSVELSRFQPCFIFSTKKLLPRIHIYIMIYTYL